MFLFVIVCLFLILCNVHRDCLSVLSSVFSYLSSDCDVFMLSIIMIFGFRLFFTPFVRLYDSFGCVFAEPHCRLELINVVMHLLRSRQLKIHG